MWKLKSQGKLFECDETNKKYEEIVRVRHDKSKEKEIN